MIYIKKNVSKYYSTIIIKFHCFQIFRLVTTVPKNYICVKTQRHIKAKLKVQSVTRIDSDLPPTPAY